MGNQESLDSLRIDKWLWAARFFKTRSLAAEAVSGGKVHLNGQRIKPSRAIRIGDELQITRGVEEFTVHVVDLSSRRGPASQARQLYEETEESKQKRDEFAMQRKLNAQSVASPHKKPSKRDRRHIIRFIRKNS